MMPKKIRRVFVLLLFMEARWMSARRAMIPPSPSLSARMMKIMYLTETVSVMAQKMREMTP